MRVALAVVLAAAGCSDPPLFGDPTGSVCPPTSTLTYENFGKHFMDSYCTRCHATALVGNDCHGAPSFHDFDTIFGVRAVRDHIDLTTAAGPDAINTSMPNDDEASPTVEERRLLGEWLACGSPSDEHPLPP